MRRDLRTASDPGPDLFGPDGRPCLNNLTDVLAAVSACGASLSEFLEDSSKIVSSTGFINSDHVFGLANRNWADNGKPKYELTASMAALLASTKAPRISERELPAPFDSFMVVVPGEFTSMRGVGPLQIFFVRVERKSTSDEFSYLFASRRHSAGVNDDGDLQFVDDQTVCCCFDSTRPMDEISMLNSFEIEVIRYLVNVCLFLSTHRERASGESKSESSRTITVRPPGDISVTSEFRMRARSLISAKRIAERRAALLHMVRGHWRNQARGKSWSERALTWVKPHTRGSGDLGRIVERTTVLEATEAR